MDPQTTTGSSAGASPAPALPGPARAWAALLTVSAASLYTWALTVLSAWVLVSVAVFGMDAVVLRSGSMQPWFQVGDVVVNTPVDAPTDLQPPTVVTFTDPADPGRLTTHRIAAVRADGAYTTRGDANLTADSDPVEPDQVVGVGRWLVPAVGLPLVWVQAGRTASVAAWLVATVLAAGAAFPPRTTVLPDGDPDDGAGVGAAGRARQVGMAAAVAVLAVAVVVAATTQAAWAATTATTGSQFAAADGFGGPGPTGRVFLRNAADDAPSALQPIMPTSAEASTTSPTPDFSTDVDGSGAGRRLDPGTTLDDPEQTAIWRIGTPDGPTTLPDLGLDVWVRYIDGDGRGTPKVTATAWYGTEPDDLVALGSHELQLNRDTFTLRSFTLPTDGQTVPDGQELFVSLQVTRRPIDVAYSSADHPSAVTAATPVLVPDW